MAHIRITGTGEATSAPDEATFNFGCAGHGSDAPNALAIARRAAEQVIELLDEMGVGEDKRGVQRAHVHPRVRWNRDREVRDGWDANASVRCSIEDPEAAFELLERAAKINHVTISGPNWRIGPENEAHGMARHAAVADAKEKARSYAAAAGLTLGDLIELTEGGMNAGPMPMMMGAARAEAGDALEPAHQTVYASVTLVFEAS